MNRTENYNLPQFEPTDTYKLEDYNEAYRTIDEKLKEANDKGDSFNDFKNNGGTINGNIRAKGDWQSVGIENSSGDNSWFAYARPTGTGMTLCKPGAEHYNIYTNELSPVYNSGEKDLGADGSRWNRLFCKKIYASDTVIYKNNADSMICNDSKGASIGLQTYCANGDIPVIVFTSGQKLDDSTFRPNTASNLKIGLGSAQARWRELYFGQYYRDLNGYTDLPNGLKLVWGNFDIYMEPNTVSFKAVTFPISFKTQVFFSGANCRYNITDSGSGYADNMIVNCCNTALDSSSVAIRYIGNTAKSFKVCWFAVGV